MLIESAFPKAPDAGEQPRYRTEVAPTSGSTKHWSAACRPRRETQAPPEETGCGAEMVKVMWEWAPGRITALIRACIELGHHPGSWKTAKGVVIPKPAKPDYT